MAERQKPEILRRFGQGWIIKCPGCGLEARADEDQVLGRVSVDCPQCPYHETHNLLEGECQPGS